MNPIQRAAIWLGEALNPLAMPAGQKNLPYPALGGGGNPWWNSVVVLPGSLDWKIDERASSAVMACVRWVCRTFPEAPLQVVRINNEGAREVQLTHKLPSLLEMPNPYYTGYDLWKATIADWMVDGNAYWYKVRNGQGIITELWWVPESMIEPAWPEDGDEYLTHYVYSVNGKKVRIEPEDIVHFKDGIDPHNTRKGLSPLASLVREIYTDEEAAAFSATILKNMGIPGVILVPKGDPLTQAPMNPGTAREIKDQFKRATTGDNRGEPIVMGSEVDVKVLSFNPDQMNLKDLRRIPEERIAAVYGIPAGVVGLGAGLERNTFSNYEAGIQMAYEGFIIPMQREMGAALRLHLLAEFGETGGLQIQFDTSNVRVLQEDANKMATRWAGLYSAGVVTRNEARTAIGLPIETEADEDEELGQKDTPILGYHIESGVVSRNEARRQLGLPPEDETEDLELRRVTLKLAVMKLAKEAGLSPQEGAELARLGMAIEGQATPQPAAAQLPPPPPEKGFKAYGNGVRSIERRAEKATREYLNAQYEKAAAAGRAWQSVMDLGPEARALWNQYYPLIVRAAWRDVGDELGATLAFDLENQWVKGVLDELAKAIVGVAETTREEVRALVAKGAEEGWSIDDLAAQIRQLKEVHSAERARLIARTETATAYSAGSYAGYREAGVDSVEWLVTEPCPECAPNADKIIPLGEKFPSGHLHPPAHPACKCAIAPVIGE